MNREPCFFLITHKHVKRTARKWLATCHRHPPSPSCSSLRQSHVFCSKKKCDSEKRLRLSFQHLPAIRHFKKVGLQGTKWFWNIKKNKETQINTIQNSAVAGPNDMWRCCPITPATWTTKEKDESRSKAPWCWSQSVGLTHQFLGPRSLSPCRKGLSHVDPSWPDPCSISSRRFPEMRIPQHGWIWMVYFMEHFHIDGGPFQDTEHEILKMKPAQGSSLTIDDHLYNTSTHESHRTCRYAQSRAPKRFSHVTSHSPGSPGRSAWTTSNSLGWYCWRLHFWWRRHTHTQWKTLNIIEPTFQHSKVFQYMIETQIIWCMLIYVDIS